MPIVLLFACWFVNIFSLQLAQNKNIDVESSRKNSDIIIR